MQLNDGLYRDLRKQLTMIRNGGNRTLRRGNISKLDVASKTVLNAWFNSLGWPDSLSAPNE